MATFLSGQDEKMVKPRFTIYASPRQAMIAPNLRTLAATPASSYRLTANG
jgi:hypothetical protein